MEYQFALRPDSNAERKWIASFPKTAPPNTVPPIRIFVGLPPPREQTRYTLQQVSDLMLRKDSQEFRDWQQDPSAEGTVNGLHVVRTPWRGTTKRDNIPLRGVTYVGFDNTAILNLTAVVRQTEPEDSLALVESAVLTFRRSGSSAP